MENLLLPMERRIDREKVLGYLLDPVNSRGKAELFYRLGFSQINWGELQNALFEHAKENPVTDIVVTRFGTKYLITGPLNVPIYSDDLPIICAVWQQDNGVAIARLITAYPGKETKC